MKAIKCLLCVISISLSFLALADINTVEAELMEEIKQANKAYKQQTKTIANERRTLLKKLAIQEQQLKALSVEEKLITRAKDEQNLSVDKLQQRLKTWQQQQNYIEHLFASIDATSPITSAKELSELINQQTRTNAFIPINVALKNGEITSGKLLSVGPAHIYISDDLQQAGLVNKLEQQGEQQWLFSLEYDDEQLAQLKTFISTKRGLLALDTTNNRSVVLSQNKESIKEHLRKGGIWVLPILAFALLALIISIFKASRLMRLPTINMLSNKNLGKYQQKLFDIAQKYQGQERDDLLLNQLTQTKRGIEKGLSAIAVTASIAPLLGLLGTVSGMIQTFKLMTLFGAGDANAVSGGISESLVTTEMGLIVAIPALVIHAIMSRRCHHYMAELESYAVKLSHTAPVAASDENHSASVVHEVSNVA